MNIQNILNRYLVCALWAEVDDNCDPLDKNFSIEEFAEESVEAAKKEIEDFIGLLEREEINWQDDVSDEQFGHDFWLTRNGHGCGFWDRGLGQLGDNLTKWAKSYGGASVIVGRGGKLYIY